MIELELKDIQGKEHNLNSYHDIIEAVGFNCIDNIYYYQNKAEISKFLRFSFYTLFSSVVMITFFGFSIPWYAIPIMIGVSFMSNKENDANLLKIFSFANQNFKYKAELLTKISTYKKEMSDLILSNIHNQSIILKFLYDYEIDNRHMLPNSFYRLLEQLKESFHLNNDNSIDLLNKINQYIKL